MTYQIGQQDKRPWGTWEVIGVGSCYVVKRIVVHPGQRLSLQRHRHRSEHWIIVAGDAVVTCGTASFAATAGCNAVIGQGDAHRISNPGSSTLVFIEVQHGEHLDENDIERLQDDYGRSTTIRHELHMADGTAHRHDACEHIMHTHRGGR